MPRGGFPRIDWGKPENTERLLAAILAAQEMKIDYHRVAKMFGYGATYSTIEEQLLKSIRFAATLPDDDWKKSEEIDITADETEGKGTPSGAKSTPARVKRSARVSYSGLSEENVPRNVPMEKKKETGRKVVSGRVIKGSGATSRKGRIEDEVKVIEVVQLE